MADAGTPIDQIEMETKLTILALTARGWTVTDTRRDAGVVTLFATRRFAPPPLDLPTVDRSR